ncbi:MAG: MarR family transcriptional regulator [Roseiarcus sp.]|jgi:DNA-binding MarR family transcriptional regulator
MGDSDRESIAAIVRAVLSLGRRLRAERPQGAPALSAIAVLSALNRLGPTPAARLAAEERLQPQSLTRIVAGLERQGWIARARNPRDRREITIALTPHGRSALADDMRARRRWLEQALADALTEAERAALLAASKAMLKLALYQAPDGS